MSTVDAKADQFNDQSGQDAAVSHQPDPDQHGGASEKDHSHSSVTKDSANTPNEKSQEAVKSNPDHPQSKQESKGPPGGYDATPVPHRPPGYTVKFTFHRATALPIGDPFSLSSDPYLVAELSTAVPTRHKEDPPLRFRTRTVFKNTAPVWNEEWIIDNVPATGFKLKARLYDEDRGDADDRLGNAHVTVGRINEGWEGISEQPYKIKKRMGSKRAYLLRALAVCTRQAEEMSGHLYISVRILGRSTSEEGGRVYTVGLQYWCKHYSPLLGRITGSKTTQDDSDLEDGEDVAARNLPENVHSNAEPEVKQDLSTGDPVIPGTRTLQRRAQRKANKKQVATYNFQANQMQLRGPVPPELYHRYVEFRPFVKALFTASGIRGIILAKALHHQHAQVYNFNLDTKYGVFRDGPCDGVTRRFLDLCHYDEGGRIFTYVLSLDALLRFTETGKEFGIDMLSKHTMHSDASSYIAFSGEFFIRRRTKFHRHSGGAGTEQHHPFGENTAASEDGQGIDKVLKAHNDSTIPSNESHAHNTTPRTPAQYQLFIDNDSGTYRPKAALLPLLHSFLSSNLPGLKIITLDCQSDKELMDRLKSEQREIKRKANQGPDGRQIVYTQASSSASSVSSSDVDRLERREEEAMVEDRFRREEIAGTGQGRDDDQVEGGRPAPTVEGQGTQPRHKVAGEALTYVKNSKLRNKLMTESGQDDS